MQGGIARGLGLAGNQVGYRFCLGQVELAIEKGALRELPGPGEPRPLLNTGFDDLLLDKGRAMAGQFYHVFPGIGSRALIQGDDNFIDHRVSAP